MTKNGNSAAKGRVEDADARALAQSTDALNEMFDRASQLLRRLGFGVEAKILIETVLDDQTGQEWYRWLAYEKVGDRWALQLIEWDGIDEGPTATSLITTAPRRIRVKAAHLLPKLVEELRLEVRRERQRVDEARRALEAFVAAQDEEAKS